jgi:hypothetical protein
MKSLVYIQNRVVSVFHSWLKVLVNFNEIAIRDGIKFASWIGYIKLLLLLDAG